MTKIEHLINFGIADLAIVVLEIPSTALMTP